MELFRNIDGLTEPFYEDGTIYLTYASEEDWIKQSDYESINRMSQEERQAFYDERDRIEEALQSAIQKSGHTMAVIRYDYEEWHSAAKDPAIEAHMQDVGRMNLVLLLFSGLIVFNAYRNHIAGFSQEVADLRALGAVKGQITKMFLVEFVILFPLAAASSIGLSWIVMRYLYEHFLGNTADSATVWEVFHMDAKNTALEILFYFLVCLCALAFSLLFKSGKRKIKKSRIKSSSLAALWIHQTKPPLVRCLFILVPLLTAFLLLFNRYLSIYAKNVYRLEDSRIVVTSTELGFSQEELDMVYALDGVNRVNEMKNNNPLMLLFSPEGGSTVASVHMYRDDGSQFPPLGKYEIAATLPESAMNGVYHLADLSNPQERIEVRLTRILPSENGNEVEVCISNDLSQELMADAPIVRLEIYADALKANSIEKNLRRGLPSHCLVTNFQNLVDTAVAKQEGRLLLLSWIFGILMIVAMQIIWVRLAGYVRDCAPMLRIISHVGGSRSQLAALIPAWLGAVPAVVLPFAIAIPWAKLEAAQNNRPFIISVPVLGIYLIIGLLCVLTFWWPIKYSLHRVLKEPR